MPERVELDDDALDALLRAADPGDGGAIDEHALLAAFRPSGRRARRFRRRVALLGGGLVVLLGAGFGAPAIADRVFAARTDVMSGVRTYGSEEVPGSEWINLGEPDSVELAPRLWDDDLPLPAGYDGEGVSRALVYDYRMTIGPGLVQAAAISMQFEDGVRCLWRAELAAAPPDSPDAHHALAVLEDSVEWPITQQFSDATSINFLEAKIAHFDRDPSAAAGGVCAEIVEHVDWYVGR
jgi:hypothetical protein